LKGLEEGRVGAASRLISILEQGNDSEIDRIMEMVYPKTGHSWIVGITGPPGAGKSSLLNNLIYHARTEDKTVGAILVDPTSPLSGGAVLGDRIRMSSFSRDNGVFMRSMGSRGSLGGLSIATLGAVRILDYLKKDIIFVETVGTGQIDISICDIADTVCLVLMPGAGDVIQSLKAGIREVNDIFVVNKCDRPGAQETASNIQLIVDIAAQNLDRDFSWQVPICPTDSLTGDGITGLWGQIKEHRSRSEGSEFRRQRKKTQAKKETMDILLRKLEKFFRRQIDEKMGIDPIINDIILKMKSPQRASDEIFSKIADSSWTLSQLAEGRKHGPGKS
ncbi:MAG: methylmalonyl Co-A mutase-associated GTPase MeaB, partial [Pseudomonadota bacterium]